MSDRIDEAEKQKQRIFLASPGLTCFRFDTQDVVRLAGKYSRSLFKAVCYSGVVRITQRGLGSWSGTAANISLVTLSLCVLVHSRQ